MEYQQQDKNVVCGSCSAVMLVGTKNGNISVGEVEKDHKDEVNSLFSACCASLQRVHLSCKLIWYIDR